MSTHISEIFDAALLDRMLAERFVKCQTHPVLPLYIYNYTQTAQFERVWNDVTRRCRGLITDIDGNVVARPFPKFFNLGEHDISELPIGDVQVTDKLDGSLGILYPTPSGHAIATRGSFDSEQAMHATRIWEQRYAHRFSPDPSWTMLFEIIYPSNRIVVDYDGLDDLVLLGAVNNADGCSIPLAVVSRGWPGPVVDELPYRSLQDALSAPQRANREGIVVHFMAEDLRVKIKQDEYVRLHRLVTGVSERRIWEALSAGEDVTDWLEAVPDELFEFVTTTRSRLLDDYGRLHAEAHARYDDLIEGLPADWSRKEFALAVKDVDWSLSRAFFLILDAKPFDHLVWREIRPCEHIPLFARSEDEN